MGKFHLSRDELATRYLDQRLTMQQIADEVGVRITTVHYWMKKYGIERRSNAEAHVGLTKGSSNGRWKGGSINRQGYRLIHKDSRPRLEHRVVMEQVLGRSLLPQESVHHRNGDKLDNRPDNLELIDPVAHGELHAAERAEKGISNQSSLTAAQVAEIRARRLRGEALQSLATDFGVSIASISRIALRKTWQRAAGGATAKRQPAYLLAAVRLYQLGLNSFTVREKPIVRELAEACGRAYRGKVDDAYVSEAIAQYVKRGGTLWQVAYQFAPGDIPEQRERVFTLQVSLLAALSESET